jgi:F-type H+-transporting ATPase subunit epsilon
MADRIHLQIVTAGGVVFDRMVHVVNLPLENGSIGVLANHAPLMGAVVDGVVTCASDEGEYVIAVGIGVVNIVNNAVTVLSRTAEEAEDIDLARAEAAEKRARERLAAKNADTNAARAEAALHRAVARQHAAHMVKKHK